VSPRQLWGVALAAPIAAGAVYFMVLRLVAPQHSYCGGTAQTYPWYGGAELNGWGAIGLGLIAVAALAVLIGSRRSSLTFGGRAIAALAALVLAGALVSFAYLVLYFHYGCGE
jgi:hypothetical protein